MSSKSYSRRAGRWTSQRVWLACGVLPLALGCGDSEDEDNLSALPGEIGSNHFFYQCATIDDAHCREDLTSFPEKLAVGATFDLLARDSSGNSDNLFVESVSPTMVAPSEGEFLFLQPGHAAFLAFRSGGGLQDFVHLQATEVAELMVQDVFGETLSEVVLTSGQKTNLTVVPLDEDEDVLAGSLVYRWVSDNDASVLVERAGTTVNIVGQEPGTARLRVSLGSQASLTLDVIVQDGPIVPPRDAGQGDAEAPDSGALDGAVEPAPDAAVTPVTDAATEVLDSGETMSVDAMVDAARSDAATPADGGGEQ